MKQILGKLTCINVGGWTSLTAGKKYAITGENEQYFELKDNEGDEVWVEKELFALPKGAQQQAPVEQGAPAEQVQPVASAITNVDDFAKLVKEGTIQHFVISGIDTNGAGFTAQSVPNALAKAILADSMQLVEANLAKEQAEQPTEAVEASQEVAGDANVTPMKKSSKKADKKSKKESTPEVVEAEVVEE